MNTTSKEVQNKKTTNTHSRPKRSEETDSDKKTKGDHQDKPSQHDPFLAVAVLRFS